MRRGCTRISGRRSAVRSGRSRTCEFTSVASSLRMAVVIVLCLIPQVVHVLTPQAGRGAVGNYDDDVSISRATCGLIHMFDGGVAGASI